MLSILFNQSRNASVSAVGLALTLALGTGTVGGNAGASASGKALTSGRGSATITAFDRTNALGRAGTFAAGTATVTSTQAASSSGGSGGGGGGGGGGGYGRGYPPNRARRKCNVYAQGLAAKAEHGTAVCKTQNITSATGTWAQGRTIRKQASWPGVVQTRGAGVRVALGRVVVVAERNSSARARVAGSVAKVRLSVVSVQAQRNLTEEEFAVVLMAL